jgi:hypothetical protein
MQPWGFDFPARYPARAPRQFDQRDDSTTRSVRIGALLCDVGLWEYTGNDNASDTRMSDCGAKQHPSLPQRTPRATELAPVLGPGTSVAHLRHSTCLSGH